MNAGAPAICLNCETDLHGFIHCGKCGQRNQHQRLIWQNLIEDFHAQILEFNLPWVKTIRNLSLRPGMTCSDYVDGHRISYVNPMKYMFYIMAIVVLVINMTSNELLYVDAEISGTMPGGIKFLINNIPIYILITSPLTILLLRIAFWHSARNWIEISCFLFYMLGHCGLLFLVLGSLMGIAGFFMGSLYEHTYVGAFLLMVIFIGIPLYVALSATAFFRTRLTWSFIAALITVYLSLYIDIKLFTWIINYYSPSPSPV